MRRSGRGFQEPFSVRRLSEVDISHILELAQQNPQILVGAAVTISAVVSYRPIKNLYHITTLAYMNGRYAAEGNMLLQSQELTNLLEAGGVRGAQEVLKNMGYTIPSLEGADSVEIGRAAEEIYLSKLREMRARGPKNLKRALDLIEEELLYRNIAAAMVYLKEKERGVVRRLPLIPTRRMSRADIEKIERMESLEAFYEYYTGEDVRDLEELIRRLKGPLERGEYDELFYMAERLYIERFSGALGDFDPFYRRPLEHLMKWKADRAGMRTALALALRGEGERMRGLAEGTLGRIRPWKLEQMALAGEGSFKEEVLSTPYGDLIKRSSLEGALSPDPFVFERFLDLLEMEVAEEIYIQYTLSLGTILRHLMLRRLEARNLRLVLLGLARGMPRESVMKMMITGGG